MKVDIIRLKLKQKEKRTFIQYHINQLVHRTSRKFEHYLTFT